MSDLHAHLEVQQLEIAELFERVALSASHERLSSHAARRLMAPSAGDAEVIFDVFSYIPATCCFLRLHRGHARDVALTLPGSYGLTSCAAGGWLMLPGHNDLDSYWTPILPKLRRTDESGHVLEERDVQVAGLTFSSDKLAFRVSIPEGWFMDWAIWRLPQASGKLIDELTQLLPLESGSRFLWGSHTLYRRPADVYRHLIHGHIYETRFAWPKHWKICSENDAHALYTVLNGLEAASAKQLYRLLKDQLVLSVLDRQSEDGGWRHGEWTDRMESHYRLHCSAMHMLMDALAENKDPAVLGALERAAAFIAQQTDRLDAGEWFLHDELEHSVDALRNGPFRWLPSRALGKSEGNMLVLNTHLDATIALDRYRQLTGDRRHQSLVARAVSATGAVLSERPAEWLYRALFSAIRFTFLPTALAERLPLHLRAWKRVASKYLIPTLPYIKTRYPRIVMPGGYIDRELSLRLFAHEYLPINLMDLLRYRRWFSDASLDDVIFATITLIEECRMFERWPEVKGKGYAVGFWAEALYQICLIRPEAEYRRLLVQAVIALDNRKQGLPPSLLGANSETVPPQEQVPSPMTDDGRIKVVNLSYKGMSEVLLTNCSSETVRLHIVRNAPEGLVWSVGEATDTFETTPQEIPASGWLWGRSRTGASAAT